MEPDRIIHPYDVSDKRETAQASEDAFRRLLKQNPEMGTYDAQSQRFRLKLGDGYEVAWTGKLGLNSEDMIFAIAADPLIEAGLDTTKPEDSGWLFIEEGDDTWGMGAMNQAPLLDRYTLTK